MTGRSVCNDASADCKGVARAVVADQAALDARKKSRQAKSDAANATASADANNNKRSKKLIDVEARGAGGVTDTAALEDRVNLRQAKAANATADARRSLGDVVDGAVGDVTGTVGDVAGNVGLKTRDGEEIRAVTDNAALEDRVNLRQAKASNATAEARSVGAEGLAKKAANDTADDAAAEARKTRKSRKGRKARRSHQLW